MNKYLINTLLIWAIFTFPACGKIYDSASNHSSEGGRNMNKSEYSDVRIKMSFNNEEVIVKMYENPSSRDFVSLLPLTLTFEDYARTEKITYIPRKLSTKDAPSGSDPSVGDLTYYSPWGNLAIFYKDFGYASGLIKLGHIETGINKLANVNGKFEVTIEKID